MYLFCFGNDSFRKNILEKGGSDDPMKLYVTFRGAEPSLDALLKTRWIEGGCNGTIG